MPQEQDHGNINDNNYTVHSTVCTGINGAKSCIKLWILHGRSDFAPITVALSMDLFKIISPMITDAKCGMEFQTFKF